LIARVQNRFRYFFRAHATKGSVRYADVNHTATQFSRILEIRLAHRSRSARPTGPATRALLKFG
jgi:hypothetical protein